MRKPYYGGQAVLEGVMMRGQREMAVAVRHPAGHIVVHTEPLTGAIFNSRWAKVPFLRGVLMLWEMLVLGTRILMYSAEVAMDTEENRKDGQAPKMPTGVLWGAILVSLGAAIGLFFVVPVLLANAMNGWVHSALLSNLVEKAFRLALLLGYMAFVGMLPDIRRVFAYHGAEHKTINAYEDGAPLDVAHVSQYTTAHPRCGTSFLLFVVVISFLVYLLLGQPGLAERIISRIVLIPVIASIAYELLRLGADHYHNPWVRALLSPGLALQRLSTREPDAAQIETAIVALERVVAADQTLVTSHVAVQTAVVPIASPVETAG